MGCRVGLKNAHYYLNLMFSALVEVLNLIELR